MILFHYRTLLTQTLQMCQEYDQRHDQGRKISAIRDDCEANSESNIREPQQ